MSALEAYDPAPVPGDVTPFFLEGHGGPVFCLHVPAQAPERLALVYCPPFAEEMNRGRRAVAVQARRLAARGIATLIVDPYGTGDSGGDFAEADWDLWLSDLETAAAWLARASGTRPGFWGVRSGALLAAEMARRTAARHLLFWQPVAEGAAFVRQLLRVGVAAGLRGGGLRGGGPATTPRHSLAAGRPVEIAGYTLRPALLDALAARTLRDLPPPAGTRVAWLEIAADAAAGPGAASRLAMAAWEAGGAAVDAHTVVDVPFWSLWEAPLPERLLERTGDALARWP
ncbi:hydrolase 2, exosortase A system-associated [Rhodocista pekingensis]|uniref:Hydrolase 2, exosortase A system-associated n=1 Tax=Rhodocista pekingensis TaxID=201185 RepID=A0ABW2L1H7_9PROT